MAEARERRARLTKRFIDGLRADERDEVWWDTDQRGFAVRVWPSGQKTFFIRYRNREGRLRKLTLGRYGALTVDQARTKAGAKLGEVANGGDPAEDLVAHRAFITVAQLCAYYRVAMAKGLVLGAEESINGLRRWRPDQSAHRSATGRPKSEGSDDCGHHAFSG